MLDSFDHLGPLRVLCVITTTYSRLCVPLVPVHVHYAFEPFARSTKSLLVLGLLFGLREQQTVAYHIVSLLVLHAETVQSSTFKVFLYSIIYCNHGC
jgi:hypothetical protein